MLTLRTVTRVEFVTIWASNGRTYRVYPDSDIEIDVWYDGYKCWKLLDRNDENFSQLLCAAIPLFK